MSYIPFLIWVLQAANYGVVIAANLMVQSTILIGVGFCILYFMKAKGVIIRSFILRILLVTVLLTPSVVYLIHTIDVNRITFDVPIETVKNDNKFPSPEKIPVLKNNTTLHSQQNHTANSNAPKQLSTKSSVTNNQQQSVSTALSVTIEKLARKYSFSLPTFLFWGKNSPYSFLTLRAMLYIAITLCWIIFSVFFLVRLIFYYLPILYIRHSAYPAEPSVICECNTLAQSMGIKPPLILRSLSIQSPFVAGIFKPTIFLPDNLPVTREILIHELYHLVRHDFIWNLISYIGIALLPFQPLMRILRKHIEDTSDYVCDAYVLKYNSDPKSFANQLLTLAINYHPIASPVTTGAGILSDKSSLRRRIELIIETPHTQSLSTSTRCEVLLLSFCTFLTFTAGLIGFEGKSIIHPVNASRLLFEPLTLAKQMVDNHKAEFSQTFSQPSTPPLVKVAHHRNVMSNITQPIEIYSGNPNAVPMTTRMNFPISEPIGEKSNISLGDERLTSPLISNKRIGIELNGVNTSVTQDTDPLDTSSFEITALGTEMFDNHFEMGEVITGLVNVAVNFDFNNPGLDLSNEEDRRRSALYQGLDKYKSEPVWSPEGRWLAFTELKYGIWLVSPEGGEPVLLYEHRQAFPGASFGSLCFTSDGCELTFKRLIYDQRLGSVIKYEQNEDGDISVSFTNGVPVIESVNIYTGDHRILVDEGYNCTWSHNGRYLCYINFDHMIYLDPSQAVNHNKPAIYDTATGETRFLCDEQAKYGQPAFSPDDSHIVVPIEDTAGTTQLYKISISGGEPEQLTVYEEHLGYGKTRLYPDYSPDGQWILYTDVSNDGEIQKNRLYVYNTSTGETSRVFEDVEFNNGYGKWSPDGNYICYVLENDEPKRFIYISKFNPADYINTGTEATPAPLSFKIRGNYPNPFNPSTTIEFSLPEQGSVTLVIYNIMGQKVRELVHETMEPGIHSTVWNGRDDSGMSVSSGIYFSRLRMGNRVESHKMTVVK